MGVVVNWTWLFCSKMKKELNFFEFQLFSVFVLAADRCSLAFQVDAGADLSSVKKRHDRPSTNDVT